MFFFFVKVQPLKKLIPSFPATLLSKLRSCQEPHLFEKLVGGSPPPPSPLSEKGGGHYGNVVLEARDNTAQEKVLFNVALIVLRQHCRGISLMQCCSRGSQITLHMKISSWIMLQYSWNNIAQAKSPCNVAQEAPDNIAQEKIQCNVVWITSLFGDFNF